LCSAGSPGGARHSGVAPSMRAASSADSARARSACFSASAGLPSATATARSTDARTRAHASSRYSALSANAAAWARFCTALLDFAGLGDALRLLVVLVGELARLDGVAERLLEELGLLGAAGALDALHQHL